MRVLIGSAIAAVLAVAGLLSGVAQSVVVAQRADGSAVAQVADDKTGPVLAAREGGPAVYGWLHVQAPARTTTGHPQR
jgi:hypothetical protein